jgi:2-polyprenyl-6-methoxyphenol hydroxylase-like FAD-dependent oxidoreductase
MRLERSGGGHVQVHSVRVSAGRSAAGRSAAEGGFRASATASGFPRRGRLIRVRWPTPLVLIVGAGPTGLVLGLWLTTLGVRVRIIDKTAEPGTTSRALAVQVRTLEFYRQVGIADAFIAGGVKIPGLNFWVRGAKAARLPFQRIGEGLTPYPFVLASPQDAHERLLIEQLDALGVKVERRSELLDFDQNDGSVRATLKRSDGSEEVCEAAYLAGCDGASSTVREHLAVGFAGGTYAGLFYVADVEATGSATDGELHADLEEANFVLVIPLKGEDRVRLVGTVREPPDGGRGGLTFDDVRGRAIEGLGLDVAKVSWFSAYHVHHRVASCFRQGRTFLLGDAAHVHSPVGGQGMNTGIGDAVNLAWKLAAVLKEGAAASLLDTYEPERIGFARRLIATTDRIFTLMTERGRAARFVRTKLFPLLAPVLFRLRPLRRFLFRTSSQISIDYRNSPLSAGTPGPFAAAIACPGSKPRREKTTSHHSLRWPGRSMCTANRNAAWSKPAPHFGCRSIISRGSRECGDPVSNARRSLCGCGLCVVSRHSGCSPDTSRPTRPSGRRWETGPCPCRRRQ